MEVGESRLGDYLVLHVRGRLDTQTSDAFQARLLAAVATPSDVIIDFAGVEYISSAGLSALMIGSRRKAKDHRMAVAGPNELVREIFEIAGFHHLIPVFSSVEEVAAVWDSPTPAQPVADPGAPVRVHFWGTRGSLPAPLTYNAIRSKIRDALMAARDRRLSTENAIDAFIDEELRMSTRGTFGGNTSCVELATDGEDYLLCDLGTGVREFGNGVLARHGPVHKGCFHVFMSHLHWDHIMGFPFFVPAYVPGNRIRIYGCHKSLRDALMRQHSAPSFPVDFGKLGANIEFVEIEPGTEHQVAGFSVSAIKQFHEGDSYGYRFHRAGKTIVYSTDCEHKPGTINSSYPFIDFYNEADLLIFDAMYSLADTVSVKEDWGHSSNIVAVELAQRARVKRLALFHHEPAFDDPMIEKVLGETVRFEEISRDGHKVEVISAYDGLELIV